MADLDSSTKECAQVCALHTGPHLASLRKIEMVAVLCTNETIPNFLSFLLPSPRPPGADGPHRGRGHVGRHYPYTNNIWCRSVHVLLRYRSKTANMQKFPIDSRYQFYVLDFCLGLAIFFVCFVCSCVLSYSLTYEII